MAQTGYTPIQLYHSTTPGAAPVAADLLPGELAINIADGKVFYEDSVGAVKQLSGGIAYVYTTTPITLVDKQGALTDTSGGAFTVTLPAAPAVGVQVVVADAGASWGTNNLTVARNGSTIGGLAQDLVCDITGASVQLVYDGTTWEVYAQVGGNGGNAVTLNGVQTLTNKTFGNPTVVGVNSSSDALRITQTGTGNALVVEDSANPDATPFVVNADGTVIVGATSPSVPSVNMELRRSGTQPIFAATGDGVGATVSSRGYNGTPSFQFIRTRGSVASPTSVANGDVVGQISFQPYDGTSYPNAATILTAIDGTPGTNDMPGRLVFSTTADGESSPTERMRIDNQGRIGFNSTSLGGGSGQYRFAGNITGNIASAGILYTPTIQSDVTSVAVVVQTQVSTQDAAFTLTDLAHFRPLQATITGGSRIAPTNQYGFQVTSGLTGATNNFAYHAGLNAAAGRWNFYAAGTADNYFAGNVGIGTTTPVAKFDLAGDYKEGVVTANTGTTYTINTATGTVQILTLTGNCTFTFPTAVAGESFTLLLRQDGTGGRTVTWPANVRWPGGTAPTITSTASRQDKYIFTADGTNWYGSNGGQNYTV